MPARLAFRFRLLVLSFLSLLAVATAVEATHFRGGTMSTRVDETGTLWVEMTTLWRDSFIELPQVILIDELGTTRVRANQWERYQETIERQIGMDLDGFYARVTTILRYPIGIFSFPAGLYTARFEDCCRVDLINNVGMTSFRLESKLAYVPGQVSGSPSMRPATIDIAARGRLYTQSLLSQDPDRGPLSYEFIVGAETPDWGPASQISGIGLDADGIISIPAANTASLTLGRWTYKVRVTDTSGAISERDILLLVQDPTPGNTAPILGPLTTPQGPYSIGTPISFPVTGTDADANPQRVTVRSGPLPWGAAMPEVTATPPGTAASAFAWTPIAGDEGIYRVYFETWDSNPSDWLFTPYIDSKLVQITVASHGPPVIASLDDLCVPPNVPISVPVSASDPDGTTISLSASFLPTGASFAPATGVASVSSNFVWTPTAAQVGSYTIQFAATDSGFPPLTATRGFAINVTTNLPAATLSTGSVVCGAAETISLSLSGGAPPYTISWQARATSSDPWITFEIDSVVASPGNAAAAVHPPSVGFPQSDSTQYRAFVRDSSACQFATGVVSVSTGPAPSILTHPLSVTICAGQTATYSATATGTLFRWQRSDDLANWTDLPGSGSATYVTPPQFTNGYYRCISWSSSCGAEVASNPARLTILPPPTSVAGTLRAEKIGPPVVFLEWGFSIGASSYRVLRCDASGGPCSPSLYRSATVPNDVDAAATAPSYWYLVEAENACGIVP